MSALATTPILVVTFLSALFYSVAMVSMKLWSEGPNLWVAGLIGAALLVAVVLEIAALRSERLGVIYAVILGMEVVLIGAASIFVFQEAYSTRELAGIGLVLLGTLLAWA